MMRLPPHRGNLRLESNNEYRYPWKPDSRIASCILEASFFASVLFFTLVHERRSLELGGHRDDANSTDLPSSRFTVFEVQRQGLNRVEGSYKRGKTIGNC
ncbi:unnamed protein product [Heterotrigona itama]|uniref:Uncharacterized protein n=1 Tax=Heterotrigona itama TaxID=395501 RepID=A0A6V7HGR4_9HYME|nr:unnamed protein product [Heterotrigona itama]